MHEPKPHLPSLVEELQALEAHANGQPITLGDAVTVMVKRGPALVLLLVNLIFLFPLPLPGLSTPVGFAVAFFGTYVALQRKVALPKFLSRRTIQFSTLQRMVRIGTKWGGRLEKVLKPRLSFMLWPAVNVLIGVSLIFCGLFLALPLPIPFTNAIPAVAIVLLLLGLIEGDGVFILAGEIWSAALLLLTIVVVHLLITQGWVETEKILRTWLPHFLHKATTQGA